MRERSLDLGLLQAGLARLEHAGCDVEGIAAIRAALTKWVEGYSVSRMRSEPPPLRAVNLGAGP